LFNVLAYICGCICYIYIGAIISILFTEFYTLTCAFVSALELFTYSRSTNRHLLTNLLTCIFYCFYTEIRRVSWFVVVENASEVMTEMWISADDKSGQCTSITLQRTTNLNICVHLMLIKFSSGNVGHPHYFILSIVRRPTNVASQWFGRNLYCTLYVQKLLFLRFRRSTSNICIGFSDTDFFKNATIWRSYVPRVFFTVHCTDKNIFLFPVCLTYYVTYCAPRSDNYCHQVWTQHIRSWLIITFYCWSVKSRCDLDRLPFDLKRL